MNEKLAKGLITKSQWHQYIIMLKKWVTITRKEYKVKVTKLKEKEKTGEISHTEVKKEVKKLKKVVKKEIEITKTQAKGVVKVLKSKVKVGKITQTQFKIAVKKVKTRTLITKAEFKTEVSSLKIKMQ